MLTLVTSSTCCNCKLVKAQLEKNAIEHNVICVDVDEGGMDFARKYRVTGCPALVKDDQLVAVGFDQCLKALK